MGRPPSLATAARRPTRARIAVDDLSVPNDVAAAASVLTTSPESTSSSTSQASTPQFPRRAPRTGTAYQHKVPAYQDHANSNPTELFHRLSPMLMSVQCPHETVTVMEEMTASAAALASVAASVAATNTNTRERPLPWSSSLVTPVVRLSTGYETISATTTETTNIAGSNTFIAGSNTFIAGPNTKTKMPNQPRPRPRVGGQLMHSAAAYNNNNNNNNPRDPKQPKASPKAAHKRTLSKSNSMDSDISFQDNMNASAAVDSFLAFAQPLVQSMPENGNIDDIHATTGTAGHMQMTNKTTECWMHQILEWHIRQLQGASTNNTRSRKGRASKRPRATAATVTAAMAESNHNSNSNNTGTGTNASAGATDTTHVAAESLPNCVLAASARARGMASQQQQQQQQQPRRLSKKRALSSGRSPTDPNSLHTESDAHLLSYLMSQQQPHQHQQQAEWKLLVDLTAGQACSTQRKRQRQLYKNRYQQPAMQTSDSWRKTVSRCLVPMVGDFRNAVTVTAAANAAAAAAVANAAARNSAVAAAASNNDTASSTNHGYGTRRNSSAVPLPWAATPETPASTSEDYQGVWKAVLACAQVMGRHLQEEKPILLSAVVCFVNHAYQLPIPEVAFDKNAVVASHMTEEVSACMWTLLQAADIACKYQAKLLDLWSEDGVDTDQARKLLEAAAKATSVRLDEADEMQRQVEVVSVWTDKLEAFLANAAANEGNSSTCSDNSNENNGNSNNANDNNDQDESRRTDLEQLEAMAAEARAHGFRCKALVHLERKIKKAHQLRDRILDWKRSCEKGSKETIKFVAAMVRDIQRLKLTYPVVTELLSFHRSAESWVDRAHIAIRSKISLQEIKLLIARGEEMPLDLSEYLDKLRSRACLAEDWLVRFQEVVPRPTGSAEGEAVDMLEWMKNMREQLDDTDARITLHDLVSEGSRIPVEVDCVKLLQVELDARNWMAKARQWIPSTNQGADDPSGKRGRLDDLRDHVEKAAGLRDKIILSPEEKKAWVLDGEAELGSIVDAVGEWFSEYEEFLEGDNRRNTTRCCLSIEKLRKIVAEGNVIYANMGTATSKMSKILVQAESWYEDHYPLLVRCNLRGTKASESRVEIAELTKAVQAATSDISLDLDEVMEIRSLVEKIQHWLEQVSFASGSKRPKRGKKLTFAVDDLYKLIEEASELPIETEDYVKELKEQAQSVQTWQERASSDLERILLGFQQLQEVVTETYGLPAEFARDRSKDNSEHDGDQCGALTLKTSDAPLVNDEMDFVEEKKAAEDMSHCETMSTASEHESSSLSCLGSGDCNVHVLIRAFCKDAKHSCIATPEGEVASQLEIVSRWCIRSLKYLDNQKDIFDKRFFGAFDRFVSEGEGLLNSVSGETQDFANAADLLHRLSSSWGTVLSDQLDRLKVLLSERERFVAWCNSAEKLLTSDDRKQSIEKLNELAEKSHDFPGTSSVVQQVRKLAAKASEWVRTTSSILGSEDKVGMHEAKAIFDQGEKLGFQFNELRVLRTGLKTARGWANKVKRSKLDLGATHVNGVQALIEEHDSLIVDMPEELAKLQQAMKNYCICRRPYEGFMIGCDDCDEWFHGACIGVSEIRADKVDKYVCIRCSVARVFKNSASDIAGVIRKYCSGKDLRRTRQVESQKHQRKVRKEMKDIGKLKEEIVGIEDRLRALSVLPKDIPAANEVLCSHGASAGDGINGDVPLQGNLEPTVKVEPTVATKEMPQQSKEDPVLNDPPVAEGGPVESINVDGEPAQVEDKEELASKLQRAVDVMIKCEFRLAALAEITAQRLEQHDIEDSNMIGLRTWCIRVRSLVLVPSSDELARQSRPNEVGSLSGPMLSLIVEAEKFGLKSFEDVSIIVNGFMCLSWSLGAMSILGRQPSIAEIESLVDEASSIELPDEKAVRMLKVMANRAVSWQSKVSKLLTPAPGENKPFNVDALKDLASASDDIPLCLPFAPRLLTVIEDKGARHCLCGGPSDGRFMVSCDQCDEWFHGHCVAVSKPTSEEIGDWKCPSCIGSELDTNTFDLNNFHDSYDVETEEDEEDNSSKAPHPEKMWPPFGLFGSEKANEVLGDECCAIPEDITIYSDSLQEVAVEDVKDAFQAATGAAATTGTELHVELHGHTEPTASTSAVTQTIPGAGKSVTVDVAAVLSVVPLIATSTAPQISFASSPQGLTALSGTGFHSLNGNRLSSTGGTSTNETSLSGPASSNLTISFGTGGKPVVTELPVKSDYSTQVAGDSSSDTPAVTKEMGFGDTLMQKSPGPGIAPDQGATEAGIDTAAPEDGFMHDPLAPTVQEILVSPLNDTKWI